ncbi:hypothetical protein ACOSQ3_003891 [Xanthoceras sorbifolium]
MSIDMQRQLVTVKGTMDSEALTEYLKDTLKRPVEIVPPKKDEEDKESDDSGDDSNGYNARDYMCQSAGPIGPSPNTAASQDKQARCWFPPVLGYWKINTEFALDVTKGAVGVRIIIRNHLGLVCASAAQKLVANFSPMVAEAVALLLGISFAVNSGLCPASL